MDQNNYFEILQNTMVTLCRGKDGAKMVKYAGQLSKIYQSQRKKLVRGG